MLTELKRIPMAGKKGKRLNMCPISSANWNNAANAGVWALNCNNVRSNTNDNCGFRSDSMPRAQKWECGLKGGAFLPSQRCLAKSAGRSLSSIRCKVAKRLGAFQ